MYERLLLPKLRSSKRSVLLLGPRQVGKSTLLRQLEPDRVVNLADPRSYREYSARPERLVEELDAAPAGVRTVMLDEVQLVPELLMALQPVLDDRPGRFRFLLSGSSARKLRRGRANLLPGRVLVSYLHPLAAQELGDDFELERVLAHGSLPGVYAETNASERARLLRSYADTYVREEVQAEALVRDIGGYARLLDHVAVASGKVLNVHSLCKAAEIGYETTRRYLEVLEDTLLVFRVPAWSGSERQSLVSHPKLFLFDLGVRNALLHRPLDRVLPDDRPSLLEHFVATELWRVAREHGHRLWHFRTKHGAEVDFVLEIEGEAWAIEVKAGSDVANSELRGLASFAQATRKCKRKLVVHLGRRRQKREDLELLPVRDFLAELARVV